ncbi:hypothetical protein JOC86_002234 [Bacillus pakistanensis]|uniref:Uncharacterized protein n=1 Tax=Rossellomorea pakistanensis TaxID=992288 RepID=A0ABS2NCV4_9BACI|nr:hypothetical protein [Bacillus pakistanensis]MBM7585692.1 hypothetical protein [Bacillus pakistanensis]
MKKKLFSIVSGLVMVVSLSTGASAAEPPSTMSDTGPGGGSGDSKYVKVKDYFGPREYIKTPPYYYNKDGYTGYLYNKCGEGRVMLFGAVGFQNRITEKALLKRAFRYELSFFMQFT